MYSPLAYPGEGGRIVAQRFSCWSVEIRWKMGGKASERGRRGRHMVTAEGVMAAAAWSLLAPRPPLSALPSPLLFSFLSSWHSFLSSRFSFLPSLSSFSSLGPFYLLFSPLPHFSLRSTPAFWCDLFYLSEFLALNSCILFGFTYSNSSFIIPNPRW